jgi:hypothetical protein
VGRVNENDIEDGDGVGEGCEGVEVSDCVQRVDLDGVIDEDGDNEKVWEGGVQEILNEWVDVC